jgi:hypothetical protein
MKPPPCFRLKTLPWKIMIKSFNHYTKLNYENTNIFGYLSQEILMFIKILLLLLQVILFLSISN